MGRRGRSKRRRSEERGKGKKGEKGDRKKGGKWKVKGEEEDVNGGWRKEEERMGEGAGECEVFFTGD